MHESYAGVAAADSAVFGHEDKNRRTRSDIFGYDKVVSAVENCSGGCGRSLASLGGRDGYDERDLSSIWPVERVDTPVPLSDTQNGFVGPNDIPHGFFRCESVTAAIPGMSETRLVCE